MPSRLANLIVFLAVLAISVSVHKYLYRRIVGVFRRDFPARADLLQKAAKWFFILGDVPFLFLFFRNLVKRDMTLLTQILLYPFTFWQFILFCWMLLMIPAMLRDSAKWLYRKMTSRPAPAPKQAFTDLELAASDAVA